MWNPSSIFEEPHPSIKCPSNWKGSWALGSLKTVINRLEKESSWKTCLLSAVCQCQILDHWQEIKDHELRKQEEVWEALWVGCLAVSKPVSGRLQCKCWSPGSLVIPSKVLVGTRHNSNPCCMLSVIVGLCVCVCLCGNQVSVLWLDGCNCLAARYKLFTAVSFCPTAQVIGFKQYLAVLVVYLLLNSCVIQYLLWPQMVQLNCYFICKTHCFLAK